MNNLSEVSVNGKRPAGESCDEWYGKKVAVVLNKKARGIHWRKFGK